MIYTRFNTDDIVSANKTIITTGMWSNDTGSLEGDILYLYDTQIGKSGEYYLDVYEQDPNPGGSDLAEVQFAVTYGHINGAGAPTLSDEETAKLPTRTIYSQYRNLLLSPNETKFKFQGVESDHIYVINLQRARMREQLDPGNWQLPLSGANGVLTFIDDSNQTLDAFIKTTPSGKVYNIVSGSINDVSGSVTASTNATTWGDAGPGYGLVYPDLGIIVLNPDAICPAVGFFVSGSSDDLTIDGLAGTTGSSLLQSTAVYNKDNVPDLDSTLTLPFAPLTGSVAPNAWGTGNRSAFNHAGLFVSLRNAIMPQEYEFRARSAETISSTHYFVRLRNKEYNYSNNPTFRNPDDNTIIIPAFKSDPKVYITTVGLYNDTNELLAVAKLSKPLRKSFSEEVLLRVRLDF